MRLGEVLSKKTSEKFVQVDHFLLDKKGSCNQKVNIDIGNIRINYYCQRCDDTRTFISKGKLGCVFINKQCISIDSVLSCDCGSNVQIWFLVESDNDITSQAPNVRILKKSEKTTQGVKPTYYVDFGDYSDYVYKAKKAYEEGLGAGSIVYLRKVFEKVIVGSANVAQIDFDAYENGNPKNFKNLLEDVDEKFSIIPSEFSANSYRLYRELSEVIHGDYNENMGLEKFNSFLKLVEGILININNKNELKEALESLGWNT